MFQCPRCHYQTIKKSNLGNHFNKLKTCLPIYENIPIEELIEKIKVKHAFNLDKIDKSFTNQNESKTNQNNETDQNNSKKKIYKCTYCEKLSTTSSNNLRHMRTCKSRKNKEKEKEDEKELKLKRYEEQLQILQDEIKKIKEQKCYGKVTNNYYNTQNIQNQQNIKNEIKINAFREENIDYLTPEYIMGIAKRGMYYAIPKLIEKIYFNENHPENQNVKITNEKSKYGEIFDGTRFIKCAKNLIVRDMICVSIDIIDEVCCDVDMPTPYNKFSKKYNDQDRELMSSLYKKAEGIALTYSK